MAKNRLRPKRKNQRREKNKKLVYFRISIVVLVVSFFFLGLLSGSFLSIKKNRPLAKLETQPDSNEKPFLGEVVFGKSVGGKEIKGYVVGNGSKSILLFGSIHGNEMGSDALLERLAIEIKENPAVVSNNIRLIILPIVNPDGFYERSDKLNANGVNLNLNFDTTEWQKWGTQEHQFAGEAPFTEPESRVIKKIVEDYSVSLMISFHSQGKLSIPENNPASLELAKWYAAKTGYTYDDSTYNFFGTATRWFAEKKGGTAITVELTNTMDSDWAVNKAALFDLLSDNKAIK